MAWVNLFVWAGYLFGNIPLIRNNFGFVTIGIIVVSLLPFVAMLLKPPARGRISAMALQDPRLRASHRHHRCAAQGVGGAVQAHA